MTDKNVDKLAVKFDGKMREFKTSQQEIVELLKIPEGTVKSRINRGRIELAKILRRMRVVEA